MRWYYRFITAAILIAALIGPYFIKKPDGQPLMEMPTASDFIPDQLMPDKGMGDQSSKASGTSITGSNQTFYKWQDEHGQWHYGDQPPPSAKVSTLQVDTNTNIIQSLKTEPEEEEKQATVEPQKKLPDRLNNGQLSLDNAVNALNDAMLVRDMMESRNEQLKAIAE